MLKPIDPYIYTIRVGWADCDPADIAFTARIPYFALEAMDAWWEDRIGINWYELNLDHDTGTPFVHMDFDFRAPITPRHRLECEVRLINIGDSSLRFAVVGRQNGVLCFESEFVTVTVVSKKLQPKSQPDYILEKLEAQLITV